MGFNSAFKGLNITQGLEFVKPTRARHSMYAYNMIMPYLLRRVSAFVSNHQGVCTDVFET